MSHSSMPGSKLPTAAMLARSRCTGGRRGAGGRLVRHAAAGTRAPGMAAQHQQASKQASSTLQHGAPLTSGMCMVPPPNPKHQHRRRRHNAPTPFPAALTRPEGSQSSQATESGKAGSMREWCTNRLPGPRSSAGSYTHTWRGGRAGVGAARQHQPEACGRAQQQPRGVQQQRQWPSTVQPHAPTSPCRHGGAAAKSSRSRRASQAPPPPSPPPPDLQVRDVVLVAGRQDQQVVVPQPERVRLAVAVAVAVVLQQRVVRVIRHAWQGGGGGWSSGEGVGSSTRLWRCLLGAACALTARCACFAATGGQQLPHSTQQPPRSRLPVPQAPRPPPAERGAPAVPPPSTRAPSPSLSSSYRSMSSSAMAAARLSPPADGAPLSPRPPFMAAATARARAAAAASSPSPSISLSLLLASSSVSESWSRAIGRAGWRRGAWRRGRRAAR